MAPFPSPDTRIPLGTVVRATLCVALLNVVTASSNDCLVSRTFALGFGARLERFGECGWSSRPRSGAPPPPPPLRQDGSPLLRNQPVRGQSRRWREKDGGRQVISLTRRASSRGCAETFQFECLRCVCDWLWSRCAPHSRRRQSSMAPDI